MLLFRALQKSRVLSDQHEFMYYPFFALFYLFSLLPMRILYLFSDLAYLLIYFVIGYRKHVVMANLAIAFPQKTEAERKRIAKKFYRNLTDNFIETIKLLSAGRKFMTDRFIFDNDPFPAIYASGRKCQLELGHNFNWEIANVTIPLLEKFRFLVVYMPIGSKLIDRLFYYLRSRTGTVLLPATDTRRAMMPHRNSQYLLALAADQAPGNLSKSYWLNFFGRPTPFVRGPEAGARAGNVPVVFVQIYKTKRGYYRAYTETIESPSELPQGELTRRFITFLEEGITEYPDMWLWSHRRWKHSWKPEYLPLWIGKDEPPSAISAAV